MKVTHHIDELIWLYLNFYSTSILGENFFHTLKPLLVIEAHATEGGSFSDQYRKGNPGKSIIH